MKPSFVQSFTLSQLLTHLHTRTEGLTSLEANVLEVTHGQNTFQKSSMRAQEIFWRQFKSSLTYLLMAACGISFAIGNKNDAIIILVILIINAFLGFFQEFHSEKILEKLTTLMSHTVRVRRDGVAVLLDQSTLVPGDIVTVREGDIVPADMRLISATALQVNESQISGESMPKDKIAGEATLAETLVFAGSIVEKGEGTGVIFATGSESQLGTLAKLSTETKKTTAYEKSLASLSASLLQIVMLCLALVFLIKCMAGGSSISGIFLFIIALAVAAVPEALPAIATITLSQGALRLSKQHVIIRRLSAIEDLGNVDLLCTDKTGTLTENNMRIDHITASDDKLFETLAYAAITPIKKRKRRTENSYDDAFLNHAHSDIVREASHFSIVKELPFDPEERRRRVVLEHIPDHTHVLVTLGAPEAVMACSREYPHYCRVIAEEGSQGLHHLAVAYKAITYTGDDFDISACEHGLHFLGFASFRDPLRATAKTTVAQAHRLGIAIKILSGDSIEVSRYIGQQIGLLDKNSIYSGEDLDRMSPAEFKVACETGTVFARVTPLQKYKIIEVLKEHHTVAYQGDGINDAPALKLADVAIAVNTATDIAKENADIVLLRKNLEVIINGIRSGRSVFVNINKYIKHTMVSNFGNLFALATLYISSSTLPLLPLQVLLTTIITDIPLLAIATDRVEMTDVVMPEKHDIPELIFLSAFLGIPTALCILGYYGAVRSLPLVSAQTYLFLFITLISFIVFYSVRTRKAFWKTTQPSFVLNISFALATLVTVGLLYTKTTQTWFSFTRPESGFLLLSFMLTFVYFLFIDFCKVMFYRLRNTVKIQGSIARGIQ